MARRTLAIAAILSLPDEATQENTMIQSSLTKAIKEYFGYKPGQNLTDFMTELKALTQEDRDYFKREFVKVGYEITS